MSRPQSLLRSGFLVLALAGLFVSVPVRGSATHYDWITPGCGIGGCFWGTTANWSPSNGPPDNGDTAEIDESLGVFLNYTVDVLDGLTLDGGATLHTNGFGLNVSASGAQTFIWGTGAPGINTSLFVNSGAPLGLDALFYFLSIHNGATIRMFGGSLFALFGINISSSSEIFGHGSLVIPASATGFDIAGTVRPDGGTLFINSFAPGALDLDGNIAANEPALLDITSDDLVIVGTLADPFSGTIDIGNGNFIDFDSDIEIDGDVNVVSGILNRLVAPRIDFRSGGLVRVNAAWGQIQAETHWDPGTFINLAHPNGVLFFEDDATFEAPVTVLGSGDLVNFAGDMTLGDGVVFDVRFENESTVEIGDPTGIVTIDDLIQGDTAVLKIDLGGLVPGTEHDQIVVTDDAILDGFLDVSKVPGFTVLPGQSFEIIDVADSSTGIFDAMPEGSTVGIYDGEDLLITYAGGDGNDVVVYTLPEPGTTLGLACGVLALAAAHRRRSARSVAR